MKAEGEGSATVAMTISRPEHSIRRRCQVDQQQQEQEQEQHQQQQEEQHR